MKRICSILYTALLFLTSSCVQELDHNAELVSTDGKVPIVISLTDEVTLQATTKATPGMEMGINPAIKTIHVALFGSSGYLKDYARAIPCDSEGNTLSGFTTSNASTGYFKVYLPFDKVPSRRRIHIIANGPASLPFNAYEDDIIKNLTVTDGNGAYWTRFETNTGILIKTTETASGIERDLDANGDYIPTTETSAAFQDLKLIRNFAGITITKPESAPSNFELLGFTVCNMPSEGTVAIFNESSSEWIPGNIQGVDDSGYAGLTLDGYAHLTYEGTMYPGFPVTPIINTHIPQTEQEFGSAGMSAAPGSYLFFYERATTSDTAPFVLIKARFEEEGTPVTNSSTVYYYRLDITPGNDYAPLYRNFLYVIKISGIKVPGAATPGEAAKHNSGDNFSVSIDTQSLPSVSNGTTRMLVQHTDISSLYSAGDKTLWYQFFVGENVFNGTSDQSTGDGTAKVTVEEVKTGALDSWSVAAGDDAANNRILTYTLKNPSADPSTSGKDLTSVIRITGTYTKTGEDPISISRDITITVVSPKELSASFSPDHVGPNAGEQTQLNINLPTGLNRGMFPLLFKIEDSELSLNVVDENVSVVPGPSIITSDQSYQFIRTLNWSEYQELVEDATLSGQENPVLSIAMKTIKANSATTAHITNAYFQETTADLYIDGSNYISPGNKTVDYNSHSDIAIKVYSEGAWRLSIALDNGSSSVGASVSLSAGSATGSEGQDVTVTIPENPGKNSRTYVLTLYNTDSDITRIAYIVQNGRQFKLTPTALSLMGNVTSTILSLKSEFEGDWTITAPVGCTLSSPSGSGIGTTEVTLTMPVNYSTTEDVEWVVTATGSDGQTSSARIVQRKAKYVTDQSVSFSKDDGFSDCISAKNGITVSLSAISAYQDYIGISRGTTLTLTTDFSIEYIKSVSFSYTGNNNNRANEVSIISVDPNDGTVGFSGNGGNWTGNAKSIAFRMYRSNNTQIKISTIDIRYDGWTWE